LAAPAAGNTGTNGGAPVSSSNPSTGPTAVAPQATTKYQCGSGKRAVKTSINFGCYGDKCTPDCNPIVDATFAIIRFLSAGVGIVIVASTVFASVQYTSARDDPSAVGKAKKRLTSNFIALGLFIFGYAILNYLIPAGFFK